MIHCILNKRYLLSSFLGPDNVGNLVTGMIQLLESLDVTHARPGKGQCSVVRVVCCVEEASHLLGTFSTVPYWRSVLRVTYDCHVNALARYVIRHTDHRYGTMLKVPIM